MVATNSKSRGLGDTLLALGRVSNLPTVWSNCLAGWWLGGGSSLRTLLLLTLGGSLFYTGGMFLNDAFDAKFDRRYRPERPIPSGRIGRTAVAEAGFALLAAGVLCLEWVNHTALVLGLVLAGVVLVYDAIHKVVAWAPLLVGLCRTLLYAIASTGKTGVVSGFALWCGIALGAYVTGVGLLARGESHGQAGATWPILLLGVPLVLALVANTGLYFKYAIELIATLVLWLLVCFWPNLADHNAEPGFTIPALLAGIVLTDVLAIGPASGTAVMVLLGLFAATLLLQQRIDAT